MNYKFGFVLILGMLLTSCGGKKKVASSKHQRQRSQNTLEDNGTAVVNAEKREVSKNKKNSSIFQDVSEKYAYEYAPIAKEEMQTYGIPASITLAQGMLESNSGRGSLSRRSNNHFGIKCHDWKGEKVYHDDDRRQECFRKYRNPKYSFRDHSLFLSGRSRYAALFKLREDDYRGWARGLKKAGYATDPRYPRKLISIIERYRLYRYDEEVLGRKRGQKNEVAAEVTNTQKTSAVYIVKKGDTLYNISRRYNLSVNDLKQLNHLTDNSISIGQRLYVQTQ